MKLENNSPAELILMKWVQNFHLRCDLLVFAIGVTGSLEIALLFFDVNKMESKSN